VIRFRLVGSPQAITNCAQVSSMTLDLNLSNNRSCTTLQLVGADVRIVKTVTAGSCSDGSPNCGTFTLRVTNQGPQPAQSVIVSDTLPSEVWYQQSSPPGICTYNATTRVVTCQLGALPVGQSVPIVIGFGLVGSPLAITNCAQVSATTLDRNLSNNRSCTTLQLAGADLRIVKSAPSISSIAVSYSLAVTNQGPQVAQSVVVSDTLPGQVLYTGYTTTNGTCTYATTRVVTCQLGQVAIGQSVRIGITTVRPTSSGQPFTNCAQVSSTTPDPNANDNRSCITIQIGTSSSMSIESPATGDSGSVIGFFRSIWGVLADLVVGRIEAAS
jgi:uncharacterized repeat protein (TIGR01451 family)